MLDAGFIFTFRAARASHISGEVTHWFVCGQEVF